MELPSKEHFHYIDCVIGGDECWLIHPKKGCVGHVWTEDNLHFRSIIVTKVDHTVVSTGFKKFHNYGECDDIDAFDYTQPFTAREKMDGSLLIVSRYKGQTIMRTRGTVTAATLPNGHELEFLKQKYKQFFDVLETTETHNSSYLFEWITPSNRIVIQPSDEPELVLLGVGIHDELKLVPDYITNTFSVLFDLNLAPVHTFNDIAHCVDTVKQWVGVEGVVLRQGQKLRKVKADEYCRLHALVTGRLSPKRMLEIWFEAGKPTTYKEFADKVEALYDWEVVDRYHDYIVKIIEAYDKLALEVLAIFDDLNCKLFNSKRAGAEYILKTYTGWRQSAAFNEFNRKAGSNLIIRYGMEEMLEIDNKEQ